MDFWADFWNGAVRGFGFVLPWVVVMLLLLARKRRKARNAINRRTGESSAVKRSQDYDDGNGLSTGT